MPGFKLESLACKVALTFSWRALPGNCWPAQVIDAVRVREYGASSGFEVCGAEFLQVHIWRCSGASRATPSTVLSLWLQVKVFLEGQQE